RISIFIFFDEAGVARLLGPASNLIDRLIPRDIVPLSRTGTSHLRFQQASIVNDVLLERRTFWTQGAAIDRMIRISFDVDDLRYGVLRFVAERVNDHAAAYGAVRTRTACFACTFNLQSLRLRVDRRKAEAEDTDSRTSDHGGLDKSSSGDIHRTYLRTSAWLS